MGVKGVNQSLSRRAQRVLSGLMEFDGCWRVLRSAETPEPWGGCPHGTINWALKGFRGEAEDGHRVDFMGDAWTGRSLSCPAFFWSPRTPGRGHEGADGSLRGRISLALSCARSCGSTPPRAAGVIPTARCQGALWPLPTCNSGTASAAGRFHSLAFGEEEEEK